MSEENDGNQAKSAGMPEDTASEDRDESFNPGVPFPSGSQEPDPGDPPP